jgi:RNA polymerase sigma-70 factor (ECF subfamily)
MVGGRAGVRPGLAPSLLSSVPLAASKYSRVDGRDIGNKIEPGVVSSKEGGLADDEKCGRFERLIIPHLDAAYDLARWLTRDAVAAEEIVQEAYLRAFRFFDSFRGDEGRAWMLAIVRNTFYSVLDREPPASRFETFDELAHGGAFDPMPSAEDAALARESAARVRDAVAALPLEFRETVVLRELHDLSYKEIAAVTGAPIGTVMSRLARGRLLLARALGGQSAKE